METDNFELNTELRTIGLANEKFIVNLLRQHQQLSQADLSKMTGFNSSTISYAVGRLRDKGLIIESPGVSKKRGVKPTIINLNPSGLYIIGVEINPSNLLIGLFDFNGSLVESVKTEILNVHDKPENVTDELIKSLTELTSRRCITEDKLLGIGITLSGSVSADGVVNLSSPMAWKDIPLRANLQKQLSVPVYVYSVRVRLLAELDLGAKDSPRNILYLNVANGCGGSVIIDGHLIRGSTGRVGEIGHIVVQPDGPVCGCGNKGCLEALVSGPALSQRIKDDIAAGAQTSLSEILNDNDLPEEVVEKWGQSANSGDKYAIELREMVVQNLSKVAGVAINCYDPDLVLLAGYVTQACNRHLIEQIEKTMETEVYDNASRKIRIIPAQAGQEALMRGVAIAVLQNAMKV